MKKTLNFLTKRIYEAPEKSDGFRVLVDRLWPRGITKERAAVDLWLKDVTPSNELREWIHHESDDWAEFARRYHHELDQHPEAVEQLRQAARSGPVTLLSAVKDIGKIHVPALLDYLRK